MTFPDWVICPIDQLVSDLVTLRVFPTTHQVHEHFAQDIVNVIEQNYATRGRCCVILPVGPTLHYPRCAQLINERNLDLSNTTIVHMDEYVDDKGDWIPEAHPLSFRGVMKNSFYSRLRVPLPTVVFPDPRAPEVVRQAVQRAGGLDCGFGGIGIHGHVAFNEPTDHVEPLETSRTRVVQLNQETIVMNASRSWGGWMDAFPTRAVTIGMADFKEARQLKLYADGGIWQRTALRRAVQGRLDPRFPVTLVTGLRECTIVADEATAAPICL